MREAGFHVTLAQCCSQTIVLTTHADNLRSGIVVSPDRFAGKSTHVIGQGLQFPTNSIMQDPEARNVTARRDATPDAHPPSVKRLCANFVLAPCVSCVFVVLIAF